MSLQSPDSATATRNRLTRAGESHFGDDAGRIAHAMGVLRWATGILKTRPAKRAVDEVCEIIANHHSGRMSTHEFDILWDADRLMNFDEQFADLDAA